VRKETGSAYDFWKNNLKIPKGNQKPYIEEEQTTQWSKENVQKGKKTTHIFHNSQPGHRGD
jgi:hypothetical protein